jgi:hypothetical protein
MNLWSVYIARTTTRFQQKQRVGIKRDDVEIVGIGECNLFDGAGVGTFLLHAFCCIKVFHIAHGHRIDQCALFVVGFVAH